MFRRSMEAGQVESIRQYRSGRKGVELRERRNLLGRIDSVEVSFLKGDVGVAYRGRFEYDVNTRRSAELRQVADDISAGLYGRSPEGDGRVLDAYAED